MCDLDPKRLATVGRRYPSAETTRDYNQIINDPRTDAVVIATPVATHFNFARQALTAGKHVLVEKPFTTSAREAEVLVELAERNRLTLMVDHTFVYTGAVRKIKEIVQSNELGDLLYFDSTRINLGIFQHDINVVWDLAPHDLSIMDFIIERQPEALTATGSCHIEQGIENIAYVMLRFSDPFIAHFHFNWLSPVKIRHTLIAGSRKMVVYNDIEPTEKIRVYDKGVTTNHRSENGRDKEAAYETLVSYRTGDVWVPKLDQTEALHYVCEEFLSAIGERRRPLTDGHSGLRVVRLLEAAQQSIMRGGQLIKI
jgi:predicted dehydrogenase